MNCTKLSQPAVTTRFETASLFLKRTKTGNALGAPARIVPGRELPALMRESHVALEEYLNADADELIFIPNATHGVNIVARSLDLRTEEEILTTDHEYGACDYTWISTVAKQARTIPSTDPFVGLRGRRNHGAVLAWRSTHQSMPRTQTRTA